MPILDPSLQFGLINCINKNNPKENESKAKFSRKKDKSENEPNKDKSESNKDSLFFLRYLRRASIYFLKNLETINILKQFKIDLNSKYIKDHFDVSALNSNNVEEKNFYSDFYKRITGSHQENELELQEGNFYLCKNNFYKMHFFQPHTKYSREHSWFFTDSPIAILCINLCKIQEKIGTILYYINLEIDLIAASGFSIVLCVFSEFDSVLKYFITNTIKSHWFAEIHLNLEHLYLENEKKKENDVILFFENIVKCTKKSCSYFYLYTNFFDNQIKLSKYKKETFFKVFFFSSKLSDAFKNAQIENVTNKFVFCKNGFDFDLIRIILCNVPLYETNNTEQDLVPSSTSGLSIAYVSKEDFHSSKHFRILVYVADNLNFNRLTEKYVNYNDIHIIRPDFYINDTLLLKRSEIKEMENVKSILEPSKKSHKDNIIKAIKEVHDIFKAKLKERINNFQFHTNQIFTVIEACNICLGENIKNKKVVFQVETGEGKSLIIQLIAATIAKKSSNKKIHIVSSNINLANRDYYESFELFNSNKLKSAVLLHKNELPYVNFPKDFNENCFPKEFFDDKLFENSMQMNFSVCREADIIFSTFFNFETYYLNQLQELRYSLVNMNFRQSILLIDEADSILIDELTNGTIISKPIVSNATEVLVYVYDSRKPQSKSEPKSASQILKEIKKKWDICRDISLDDVEEMCREIDIVNQPEFQNGIKYSIEKKNIKNKSVNLLKRKKGKIHIVKSDGDEKVNESFVIIPFDYSHKGILEPNKEFSGFIPQFIAIKEMFNNKCYDHMIINDISMDYLYISHPTFVKLYENVIGLTGTVGSRYEKKVLSENYDITTRKIPRNKPSLRIHLPTIFCSDIIERNTKIVNEVIEYHMKDIPILVILQDLNEIETISCCLAEKGIKNINIFDGKNEEIKPDTIAGLKGAVSLGTNFCGRGADIKDMSKPLHVVVTYHTANTRVMNQAFGRTARQGNRGTVRVICLINDFLFPTLSFSTDTAKNILEDFKIKNKMQIEFIEAFGQKRKWLFDNSKINQKIEISDKYLDEMRLSKINVNRIVAFKYMYPMCMSIPTFIEIQKQKVFSIFNCPNCKYTWILFQKYLQETILETWSLLVYSAEKEYRKNTKKVSYKVILEAKKQDAISILESFLGNQMDIVSTFMNIFSDVVKQYEDKIISEFINTFNNNSFIYTQKRFKTKAKYGYKNKVSFNFGFRPFTLITNSGARIDSLKDDDRCFITDPELIYRRGTGFLSITEAIDAIFEKICNKINSIINEYIGLKFFLRRTLAGCEFGICFDLHIESTNSFDIGLISMIDKDPLFVFTIFIKGIEKKHFLAAILIIGLVYLANVIKDLTDFILDFSGKSAKIIIGTLSALAAQYIGEKAIDKAFEKVFDKIFHKLGKIITDQLNRMEKLSICKKFRTVCHLLLDIFYGKGFDEAESLLNKMVGRSKHFRFKNVLKNLKMKYLIKTGVLLLLAFATFIMNFYRNREQLNFSGEKVTAEYEKNQKEMKKEDEKNDDTSAFDKTVSDNNLDTMVETFIDISPSK